MVDHHLFMNVIVPYVNFAVFLALLVFFARKKVKDAFVKKRQTFESEAKSAAEHFSAAEKSRTEMKQRLSALDKDLAEFEQRTKTLAEQDSQKLLQEARRMAQSIEGDVSRIIASEVEDAKEEMRVKILQEIRAEVSAEIKKSLSQDNHQMFLRRQMKKLTEKEGSLN